MLTIYYPGNDKQVCVANVAVVAHHKAGNMDSNVLITEAIDNIGRTSVLFDNQLISILNKVFEHHLAGCRYDLVNVYYASRKTHDFQQFEMLKKIEFKLNISEFCAKTPNACTKKYKRRFFTRLLTKISATSHDMTLGSCGVNNITLINININDQEYRDVISQFNKHFN